MIAGAALVAVMALPASEIVADNERSISIKNMHTGETLDVTFKRRGRYQREAMRQINWIMRDWRRDETIDVDPRLIDLVYDVHKAVGSRVPIELLSGYRSPTTNAALRRRSRNVARFSQHMVGKAMDLRIRDVNVRTVRETAMKMQRGGVGYYNGTFVHLDVGSVRHWPRMSRSRLSRLFPDGRTVHIPSDGRPMPGYEQAKRMIARAGGRSGSRDLQEDDLDTDRRSITRRGSDDAGLVLAGNERFIENANPTRPTVRERSVNDDDATPTRVAAAPATPPAAAERPARTETAVRLPETVPAPRRRPEAQPTASEAATQLALAPAAVPMPPRKPDITSLIATSDTGAIEPEQDEIQSLITTADAAASVPLPPQRPLVGAPPSTAVAQADGSDAALSPITALLANDLPPSFDTNALRGALPAGVFDPVELVSGETSPEGVDVLVGTRSVAADTTVAAMRHPDQHDVSGLIQQPLAMLDNVFSSGPVDLASWWRSQFTGSAIEALQTRLFLDSADVTGSIERLLAPSAASASQGLSRSVTN